MSWAETYHYYNTVLADERTIDWPLIGSPVPIVLISAAYLYIILIFGPRYMEQRKPYSLKTFIKYYNIFQIVANALITYHILDVGWFEDGYITCTDKVEYTYNRNSYKIAKLLWYLFTLKLVDYIETILFVLRKKYQQVSVLHMYHHVSTVFVTYIIVKYLANGYSITFGLINCPIHVIMYTYYLFASFGPKYQKMLAPVKPMLTIAQMVQLVLIVLYNLQSFVLQCPGTQLAAAVMITNVMINLAFFHNFYRKSYTEQKEKERIE